MKDIAKLEGIHHQEVLNLRRANINSVEDLWERVGEDPDTEIEQVADDVGVEPGRLANLLADEAARGAEQGGDSRLKRHAFDIALIVGLLVLLTLALRALLASADSTTVEQVVVNADADLPAARAIGAKDVIVKKMPQGSSDTFNKIEDVVGRYPLETVSRGATLGTNQLSTAQLPSTDLQGRQLLTVPVPEEALSTGVRPTARVSVLFSPREPD